MYPFGVVGIELLVPSGWELSEVKVRREKGEVAFSDLKYGRRLELTWKAVESAVRPLDIIKRMEKRLAKSGLQVKRKSHRTIHGHRAMEFRVEGAAAGVGLTWYCERKNRALILFLYLHDELADMLSYRRIVSSLKCHRDDGKELWAMLGVSFDLPEGFELQRISIAIGESYAVMRRNLTSLMLVRWHFASQLKHPPHKLVEEVFKRLTQRELVTTGVSQLESGRICHEKVSRVTGYYYEKSGLFSREKMDVVAEYWVRREEDKAYCICIAGRSVESLAETVSRTLRHISVV